MKKIISLDKSVIPACDVDSLQLLEKIVKETANVEGIGAYKIGFEIVMSFGAKKVVETIRKQSNLPIIYDHQKGGTDIPEQGEKFAKVCASTGIDAIILFPQAGPVTEENWIKAGQKEGLGIIVGGEMTHKGYLESDSGFIKNDAPKRIYEIACDFGVKDFVVPGNKPEKISYYKKIIEEKGVEPVLYSPGLITQGGELTESAKAAGKNWHAIIGRALVQSQNINQTAKELVKKIERMNLK